MIIHEYQIQREDLSHTKQGFFHEARKVLIYLTRKILRDTLQKIGIGLGRSNQDNMISSVVEE